MLGGVLFGIIIGVVGCGLFSYYLTDREIHPGSDFPAAWLRLTNYEGSVEPFETIEDAQERSRLILMRHNFRDWCDEHGISYDEQALNMLVDAQLRKTASGQSDPDSGN